MRGRIVIVTTPYFNVLTAGTGGGVVDLLEVKIGAAQFAFVLSAKILQKSEETASNVAEISASLKRGSAGYTSGSNSGGTGGSATVVKGCTSDPADGLATKLYNNNVQAVAGGGALEEVLPGVVNIRAGEWENTYIPELSPPLLSSQGIIISLNETNTENVMFAASVQLEVFG